MRIDSHQHYWNLKQCDFYWDSPKLPSILRGPYGPRDLAPSLKKYRIDKTVVVQAADNTAETDFLLDLAHRTPSIAGVVGWLDMEALGFARQFARYRRNKKFIGIRPMFQDRPAADMLRPQMIESLKVVAEQDFPFDILVYAHQLPCALKMLDRVPKLRAVVDHIAKPGIRERKMQPWKKHMAEVAAHPNVYCKISGMVTEADLKTWTVDDLRPYVEHAVECFGLNRVMFGSDWPVCLLAGNYDRVINALQQILKLHLNAATERAVFGGNAARFYKIK